MRTSLLRSLAIALGALSAPAAFAQSATDALHYKLELDLDFNARTIRGTTAATFRTLAAPLSRIDLDLDSALSVSAVRMGGQAVPFTRPTDVVRVTLDRTYQPGETFAVEIDYGGAPPPAAGFGGFRFTTHRGSPIAWTLSEPWDAKTWWPGKDTLVDKATFEIWITHPDTMLAVSNGTLQGTDPVAGNRTRSRWQESHPMAAYLASIAVTNYRKRVDAYAHLGANMPVEFYVFPESWNSWQSGMNRVVPMLTAFSNVYGQYPFVDEKYGIAQFTWGGGMEHQTVASQSSVSEWLTAHELAHQWWGDMITCATWSDIWLNEGFATFSEAVWAEANGGLASYLSRMQSRKPGNTSGSVYVHDPSNTNNIFNSNNVYRKGAWVLHMLRGALGDADFFRCLSDYRAAHAFGSATTADFRRVCEQTTGRDLVGFFDQWVMSGGAPDYRYAWRNRAANGANWVYLELDQVQASQPLFEMPVRVVVTTSAGTEHHVVADDERRDQFAIRTNAPATSVAIDPDEWILRDGLNARSWEAPFFAVAPEEIDVATGGRADYHMDHGATGAGRSFVVVLGLSGSSPGTNVGGLQIPVNFDTMTWVSLGAVNTPTFINFLGNLDANGRAVSTFDLPAGVGVPVRGRTLTGAYVLVDRFDFASRPVEVSLR